VWKKYEENPVLTRPKGIGMRDFRDPTNAWQTDDGYWMIIVGAIHQQFRQGMSLLYRSKDLRHWEPLDHVLHTLNGTGMWEMQDFFNVDYETGAPSSKWVLKVGLIDEWHDYYTIGSYDKVAQLFIPDYPELDIGSGYRHDYGKFYASKSLFDPLKKRRILVGWVNESDSLEADDAKGWASMIVSCQALKQWPFCSAFCGVFLSCNHVADILFSSCFLSQGMPRTLAVDSKTGSNLIQWPIEEVETLRGSKVSVTDVKLDAGAISKVQGVTGRQVRSSEACIEGQPTNPDLFLATLRCSFIIFRFQQLVQYIIEEVIYKQNLNMKRISVVNCDEFCMWIACAICSWMWKSLSSTQICPPLWVVQQPMSSTHSIAHRVGHHTGECLGHLGCLSQPMMTSRSNWQCSFTLHIKATVHGRHISAVIRAGSMKDTCKFSLLCLKSMTVQALVAKKSIRSESHGEVG
jgi:hypothetical protein